MSTELIEIDSAVLRDLLKKRGLTRYDLAQRLEISTKTIQRWLNHSVRRVKLETLMKLAAALETSPEELRKNSPTVSVRTTDRAVEEICSTTFLERIRLTDDWHNYLALLKTIHAGQLSSEQRLLLFKNIGISSFYLAKFRACRLYLEQALELANLLDIPYQQVDILSWTARRAEAMGNFDQALHYLAKVEALLPTQNCMRTLAEYSYIKARVHHHLEQYEQSIGFSRQALLAEYARQNVPNCMLIAVKYWQMGNTYMRLRDFSKARMAYTRLMRASEKAGWVRGNAHGNYFLGLLQHFNDSPLATPYFGKARMLYRHASGTRFCPESSQAEFVYLLISQRYAESKVSLLRRLQKTRNTHLYFSLAVLDGLFLAKLHPATFTMRPSFIEKAKEYFRRQNMKSALQITETLEKKSTITHKELIQLYVF
ncbi:MAG: helix-turn-helix transcriptional regulator [Bdellovibrio sp.]|nr:helix-turn-helix transcriptional regulator [Bdellovibrio sp.]